MFTLPAVQSCLLGVVGMFQPDDPAYPNIYSSLTASSSGIMLQNVHPLCSLENIRNIAPEFASFDYPSWATLTAYAKGARVMDGAKTYEAVSSVLNSSTTAPSVDNVHWKEIDAFSEWLMRIYGQACSNLMLTLAREKKLHTSARTLLDSQQLYQGYGMLTDKIIKRGRFVGFEIGTALAEGLIVRIDRAGVQCDTAQTLNLYLYNSGIEDPVAVFPLVLTRLNSFTWVSLSDAVLGFMSQDTDPDSSWYLGYYEDNVQGQMIAKTMNFTSAPCASCDSYNINAYNAWSRYTAIQAIEVPADAVDDVGLKIFDQSKVRRSTSTNWGLNLSMSVMCDLSPIACTNKMLLADALAQQLALEFLQQIAFNTRINAISDKAKSLAMAELDDNASSGSFKAQYIKAVRALGLDLSGMNSVCLPCTTAGTIRKRSI